MLSTVAIFAVALALVVVAGVIVEALLAPATGFRLRGRTPAVGFSIIVVLLIALGALWPTRVTAWVLLALIALGAFIATWLVRRVRKRDTTRAPLWTGGDGQGLILLTCAVAGSLFVLSPVLRLGFPTTVAALNNDGWSYAGISGWLTTHAWPAPQDSPHIFDIFGGVIGAQLRDGFSVGFESFASSVAVMTGYPTYAVVQPVAAIVIVIGAAGWFDLGRQLAPKIGTWRLALLTLPAIAPALVVIYSENYLPHAFGIALVPVALGALICWFTAPDVSSAVRSGLAVGAVLCVYPGIAPWVIGPWILLTIWAIAHAWRSRKTAADRRTARALVVVVGAPVVTTIIVAPYQAIQTVTFLARKASGAAVPYPDLGRLSSSAFVVGATGPGSIVGPPSTVALAVTIALGAFALAGLIVLLASWRSNLLTAIAAIGVAAVSVFGLVRFSSLPDFPYGVFKVLANSGALLAGFAILGLLIGSMRWKPTPFLAMVGVMGVAWLAASSSVLSAAYRGSAGFRAADITAAREVASLPPDSVTLVEGTSDSGEVFHRRMALAYVGQQYADRVLIGLGTTGSYFAPPGTDVWRPDRPWDYVIGDGSEEMSPGRRAVWSNGSYTLWTAPAVDSTPYGANWSATEGGGSFRWTTGPVEILVSNRRSTPARVRVTLDLLAWKSPREVVLRRGRQVIAREQVGTASEVQMMSIVTVAPGKITVLDLDPGTAAPAPAGDSRMLSARVTAPRVVPLDARR